MSPKAPDFLAHRAGDHVAVATRDLSPGTAEGAILQDSSDAIKVEVREQIPLGHKLALVDRRAGDAVIEYGVQIGIATTDIHRGSHVHVHNLRSARWQNSKV